MFEYNKDIEGIKAAFHIHLYDLPNENREESLKRASLERLIESARFRGIKILGISNVNPEYELGKAVKEINKKRVPEKTAMGINEKEKIIELNNYSYFDKEYGIILLDGIELHRNELGHIVIIGANKEEKEEFFNLYEEHFEDIIKLEKNKKKREIYKAFEEIIIKSHEKGLIPIIAHPFNHFAGGIDTQSYYFLEEELEKENYPLIMELNASLPKTTFPNYWENMDADYKRFRNNTNNSLRIIVGEDSHDGRIGKSYNVINNKRIEELLNRYMANKYRNEKEVKNAIQELKRLDIRKEILKSIEEKDYGFYFEPDSLWRFALWMIGQRVINPKEFIALTKNVLKVLPATIKNHKDHSPVV